jgi:hypothetical protein
MAWTCLNSLCHCFPSNHTNNPLDNHLAKHMNSPLSWISKRGSIESLLKVLIHLHLLWVAFGRVSLRLLIWHFASFSSARAASRNMIIHDIFLVTMQNFVTE